MSISFATCTKQGRNVGNGDKASDFSSDVLDKWMVMQIRLMRDEVGIPNVNFTRPYAYSGIAALESIAPGIPGNEGFSITWNGLGALPVVDKSKDYFWPASLNAALASMNHQMFPKANSVDSAAIDSLESALNNSFQESPDVLSRSAGFGKSIAAAIFVWSETDGYQHENDPYTPPVGFGLWVPTPPAFAKASTPYWGNNRPIISGSTEGTFAGTPIPYSEIPKSAFFQEVFEVYNASQNLTPDQTALALFWRDYPIGLTTAGHWLNILHQVLNQTNTNLAKAAFAYALSGTSIYDASISCWQAKYTYNQVRPITYIRNVMGFSTWNALIATPAHPEYPSAHAMLSSATAEALEKIFGDIGPFTDHSYDYLGMSPRTYASFTAIAEEVATARVLAGLHYRPSCDTGIVKGTRVADNIFNIIRWQH
ncbi:MAG: hypothetical protein C5B59_02155 [Bacteroidetes bacterium]|nr:MAG: hypothetical protein C5B59_02155 [Bacteroidota bacterium]